MPCTAPVTSRNCTPVGFGSTVQPLLFACDLAAFRILQEEGVEFAAVAGHSLGEFVALVAAEAVPMEQALRAVEEDLLDAAAEVEARLARHHDLAPATVDGHARLHDDELVAARRLRGHLRIHAQAGLPTRVVRGEETVTRSLVTGAAGFIGSHLVDELLAMGHEVVALDDLSGGYRDNVNQRARFVEGSCTDAGLVDGLFVEHRFDYVYHLAAYAAEGLSHFIKRFNYQNNLIGSVNLINAAINHEVKCFVFTSSIAVYGANQIPMTEDMTPLPEDPYGIAKLAVEQELRVSHEMFGLDYVIFRPHNVYGERQNIGDRYRNVVGIFMNQIMQEEPMTIFGDGQQTRAFTHVADVVPIIAEAPFNRQARNQVFNIGADTPYTVNRLAETVAKAMKVPMKVRYLRARNEVKHAFSSHQKLKEAFGYQAEVSLETGVERMADWARSVGPRRSRPFKHIEITKNMPEAWCGEYLQAGLEGQLRAI